VIGKRVLYQRRTSEKSETKKNVLLEKFEEGCSAENEVSGKRSSWPNQDQDRKKKSQCLEDYVEELRPHMES